jgi:hypothetical protein
MNFFENTTLADSSISMFNKKLNEWISYLPKSQQNITSLLMSPDSSVKVLVDNITTNTNSNLHIYYTSINSIINHAPEFTSHIPIKTLLELKKEWCKIRTDNQIPIVEQRKKFLPTENQLQKGGTYLKFSDIVKKRDSLPFGSVERLLLGFYTYLPPMRADYFAVEIITFKQKPIQPNYIRRVSPDHSVLTVADFKTNNTYDPITSILPPELNNELIESLRIKPRKYVFVNQAGVAFTRKSFSNWATRVLTHLFETQMTLNIIRHLYINDVDISKSPYERSELSNKMGHCPEMQLLYKWDLTNIEE